MTRAEGWARGAAALPWGPRLERERPFWQRLVASWGWRRVLDAGCGAGFHVALLATSDVRVIGVDSSIAALAERSLPGVTAADLLALPFAAAGFDAVLCLGNTFSLLPSRAAQRQALLALATVLRPGGILLLQGEDVGALVRAGAHVRLRTVAQGTTHVRLFERQGRRVRMLAGLVAGEEGGDLHAVWMVPTTARAVQAQASRLGLAAVRLPAPPPGGGQTWWVALGKPGGPDRS